MHSLAVKTDGTVWSWGYNVDGELGNGTTNNSSVPVQVSGLSSVSTVAAGDFTSYALKTDGSIWDWGYGGDGELGNGTNTNSTTATQPNNFAPPLQTTYTYDGDGLRATSTTSGVTLHFAWDLSGGLPLLLSDGSTSYLYDDDGLPLEQIDTGGTPLYYQHDQLGSTRLLTDQSGAGAATYVYDAYGNLATRTGSSDTALRWGGQYQDSATGFYYLRARYYDPQTAQFATRDQLAAQTQQPYGYSNEDPLNATDPTGGGLGAYARCMGDCILSTLLVDPRFEGCRRCVDDFLNAVALKGKPDLSDYLQFIGCTLASKACRHVALACHHQVCKKLLTSGKGKSEFQPLPLPGMPKLKPFPFPLPLPTFPGLPIEPTPIFLLSTSVPCQ
jgi:RHS repeat-associated protein